MKIAYLRTYLEMTSPDRLRPAAEVDGLRLEPVGSGSALLPDLVRRIGAPHRWSAIPAEDWDGPRTDPGLQHWLVLVRDAPAGVAALWSRAGEVELELFGLLPEVVGRGYGGAALTQTVRLAWSRPPLDGEPVRRVWLHTSSLDHPHALSNYRRRGFRPYREEPRTKEVAGWQPGAPASAETDYGARVSSWSPLPGSLALIGPGRMGRALASAFAAAGVRVEGPLGRGAVPESDVVLLCVPDAAIAGVAAALPSRPGRLVGHVSGATTLDPLAPHEAFSLHPLMTVPAALPSGPGATFTGATAAVAGGTPRALALATDLAEAVGMLPVQVADQDRAAYHASASVASNFLLTLLDGAEQLAATAGVRRERLVPMVCATVENWARTGSAEALTGPVARGDVQTVARQRAAVAERTPDQLPLFDVLVERTTALARRDDPATIAAPGRPTVGGR